MVIFDRYTAISAGAGALAGSKHMPVPTAVGVLVALEVFNRVAEDYSPGSTGGYGPYPVSKSVTDLAFALGSYLLVDALID